jgi:hypothetical protein
MLGFMNICGAVLEFFNAYEQIGIHSKLNRYPVGLQVNLKRAIKL